MLSRHSNTGNNQPSADNLLLTKYCLLNTLECHCIIYVISEEFFCVTEWSFTLIHKITETDLSAVGYVIMHDSTKVYWTESREGRVDSILWYHPLCPLTSLIDHIVTKLTGEDYQLSLLLWNSLQNKTTRGINIIAIMLYTQNNGLLS